MRLWALAALGALALLNAAPAAAQQQPQTPPSQRSTNPAELPKVFAVQIRVADLDRSERFYREGLGAANVIRIHERERSVQFASGVAIVLVQAPPRAADAPLPQGAGGFLVQVTDIDATIARIEPAGGTVTSRPNSGQGAQSFGVRAAMIRDPDGVNIELIQFPPGGPRQP